MAAPGTEEELKIYLRFAKPLALNLKDPSDRITASAWIQKLKNEEFGALKTRTAHLKLLIFALQKERLVGRFSENPASIEKLDDLSEELKLQDIARQLLEAEVTERRKQEQLPPPYYVEYSSDLREFAASQKIPNFGIHGYYAFSKEPIFLWYKSEKVHLPKDAMELDGDALHGIHLPLSGTEVPRPRLPRSPDKSKPKTISALEKSIAELEGKNKTIEPEEIEEPVPVPVALLGSPRPEGDREPPSWGSNLGNVSEPPEKEKSPKVKPKSPRLGDIEGDILEDEHPPSFLDISGASLERSSPAVCPFAASPRKQSPFKGIGDIEGDILEDEHPPSFLDISGVSSERPSPAVCPFASSPRRRSPGLKKTTSPKTEAICTLTRPTSPSKYLKFETDGDLIDEEMPPELLDLSPVTSSPIATASRPVCPLTKRITEETAGDMLDDELPPDLLDSSEILSSPKSTKITRTVEEKTIDPVTQEEIVKTVKTTLQDSSTTPRGVRRPPVGTPDTKKFVKHHIAGHTPVLPAEERKKKLAGVVKRIDFGTCPAEHQLQDVAAAVERPVVQRTTTETIMEGGVPQRTVTTVETVTSPEGIEGEAIPPEDLDQSFMNELEKELDEAAAVDVVMQEDEYEGMDKYDEMQRELDEMDQALHGWDAILAELEEENKEDILAVEREEEEERKKAQKKPKKKTTLPPQLPPTSPGPPCPSPRQRSPSPHVASPCPLPTPPCPSPRQRSPSPQAALPCPAPVPTSPEIVTPTGAPLPVVPVQKRRTRYDGGTPVLPAEERRRKLQRATRKLEYGPCPAEQRLQEIAGEVGDDFGLDQSLPDFVSSFVDDIELSPQQQPAVCPAALPATSPMLDDAVLDQSAPEFAPSFIDEIPLSPRNVVQAVTHEVITKDGVPQKETTTTTTIPKRIPQRQIPKPRGVITKVKKEVVSKNGVPQQQIVTTETIPQPSTSGIPAPGRQPSRIPSSRIPSSRIPFSRIPSAVVRSETPTKRPPRDVAPARMHRRLSATERERRQEELRKIRRRLDWSEGLGRLEDIEGDFSDQSQPEFAPSFIDEISLSPPTQQKLQKTTTKTIMKDGVPQKTITTVETVKAPENEYRLEDIEGNILDESRPQLASSFVDEISLSPKQPSPQQPCPATSTPKDVRRPPFVRPDTQKFVKHHIAGHTPVLPAEERRKKLAGVVKRIDFGTCPAEHQLQDVAAAVERPVVQRTTTETIMEGGVPQRTVTTVETVTSPEGIEGEAIPPEDLDQSFMNELEKELDEAAAVDVVMQEDEYEGMDKYDEMQRELDEMDQALHGWDAILAELEEENKEDILAVEREEEEERRRKGVCPTAATSTQYEPSPYTPVLTPSRTRKPGAPTRTQGRVSPEYVSGSPRIRHTDRTTAKERAKRIIDMSQPPPAQDEVCPRTPRLTPTSMRRPGAPTRTQGRVSPEYVSGTPRIRHTDRTRARERAKRIIDISQPPPAQDEVCPRTPRLTPTSMRRPGAPTRTQGRISPEYVSGTPRIRHTDRTTARERAKRRIDMSQPSPPDERYHRVETFKTMPDGTIKREVKESRSTDPLETEQPIPEIVDQGPSTSRQGLPPPCESVPQVQTLTEEQQRRLKFGDEYDKYEEYKKRRRPDVPATPPMFSRFKAIRDEAEGTIYEPESFGVSADEVWQEGGEVLKDLALVHSPTGAAAKFFDDETPPELIDQEEEYAKDEEEKKDLDRRLGEVMKDIQRIKNEIAQSAGLPVTLPRQSPSPRRPRKSSDFVMSESPPRFDELLPDEEQIPALEDERHQTALQKIVSEEEEYPGLLDESPPPLSPGDLPQVSEEIDIRKSLLQMRKKLFSSPTTSRSPPTSPCAEVPQPTTSSIRAPSPEIVCPIAASPMEDIDLRQLKREIREKAVRPSDKPHMDVVLGKTSAKRRRIQRRSPAPEGTFREREEDYVSPETVPGWETPPRLKARPTLAPPQRVREVWDTAYAPPRPVPDALLDDEEPPEELFSRIVDDYVDGVPVKRTETKVTTSVSHKPSTPPPEHLYPTVIVRHKPLPPVEGTGIDDEGPPEELFAQIVDEYVDGVPVKRTETKVTTAAPKQEPVCPFQPRSPTTIAGEEHFALLDESPPGLIDDDELDRRIGGAADQNLQEIVCRSPRRDILLDEEEIDLVPTSPTLPRAPRPTTSTMSPLSSLGIPSTSRGRRPPLFYRPSAEGEKIMDEVRRGAQPFKFTKFEWPVICGKTRGGKPKVVKRYGQYHRSHIPHLERVQEFSYTGDGLLEKYSELPGPPQQPLPEDLMGYDVPITSSPIREGPPHIMDQDLPLGLPSPIGQSRLPGWKTPPHLQFERKKFPKRKSPRPGPSTSSGYTKRKQIFVDGSPVRTVETKVSTPSPKGLDDVSDIEFVESPPPSDECYRPQLDAIVQRENLEDLLAQSPPHFEDISFDEGLPTEPEDHGRILQGILSGNVCPGMLDESPPPFSPDQLSPEAMQYGTGDRSPARVKRRLFAADSPPSPISIITSTPIPSVSSQVQVPAQPSTRTISPHRIPVCPATSPPSPEIDLRQLRREIREKAVRPSDKPHMDVVLGKTSAKRRRIQRRSPAPEGTFREREEDYVSPETVPGWETPPRLKARPTLAPPQRVREVWDTAYAPPRPVPDALLDDEEPPEELFSRIVDDYVDGVPVKRTETKVTTSVSHKPSTPPPEHLYPTVIVRHKPLPPVEGTGIDDEGPPEELFAQIVDEYVDGVPVKRTETKVTTAAPKQEPVCPFQPRSPTTIAGEEHFALLDESPPGLIDDDELDRRIGGAADQNLQEIVCRSPRRDILLDEEEIDLVPTSPTLPRAPRPTTSTMSPLSSLGIPSTSRGRRPPLFYRPSAEGEKIMDEVRRGAQPFKFTKFEWPVICGKTRGGKPKVVKRYGQYHRSHIPHLERVQEFSYTGDGLLEKYSELPGPPQQPLPEDLMGYDVPITSSPIREGPPHIMDQDLPLGLPSPIGQSRLPGWKTPPHLQFERKKFPKRKSPRPGPSTSSGYTKRKQIFVDGSPVRTVETKVSTPSPKGLDDVSDIEFVESPPPSDECYRPQLDAIVQRENLEDLLAQSPPHFEDISFDEGLPTEPEDHGRILQGILSGNVCPGMLDESPPPFSPDQLSPEAMQYGTGDRSPARVRRRLFLPTSPQEAAAIRTPSPHISPVCPPTSPPSPEIDPRQLRREIREKAVRPSDKRYADLVLGKTSGGRRRIPRKSSGPESRFSEREEDEVGQEVPEIPGWSTPPRLVREELTPLTVPKFDLWSDYGGRVLKSAKPPVVTEITEEMVDGVPVRRVETTVQHSPVGRARISEESPPPFIKTPPQRSPPEFYSLTQEDRHYSPISDMSPPAFITSPQRTSPRQIPLPNVYYDDASVLDTSPPDLVCSPTGSPTRPPRQIALPTVDQGLAGIFDTSEPELVCSPTDTRRRSPRQISPPTVYQGAEVTPEQVCRSPPQQRIRTPKRSPRQQPSSFQLEGFQGTDDTSPAQLQRRPPMEHVHIRTPRRSGLSGETHRTSPGGRMFMPNWPDPGTPTRSEYDTQIAFGGRSSPGILDTSPISDIESDEECDFTWMG